VKITKLAHSCLLAELPDPVNRTVLFDPGKFSLQHVRDAKLVYLDDIVITHEHFDHFDTALMKELAGQFPKANILAPAPVVAQLQEAGIAASVEPPEGMALFEAPHEDLSPIGPTPQAIGVHYLDVLSHPGDSHSFRETRDILALPITAPWGSTVNAVRLATELKPKYVVPIHDWLWRDEWREQMYGGLAQYFEGQGIQFIRPVDGEPFVLDVDVRTA
jgi:L-ascorbate metabolism protein UlaG (beta-lactamase superfamily)